MAMRREGHGGAPIGPEIPAREMGLASAMETHDAEDQLQVGDGKPDTLCPQLCDQGAVTGGVKTNKTKSPSAVKYLAM